MPVPPAPPPLETLGGIPFAFEPAIDGAGPNQWRYSSCTWGDVLVVNTATGERMFLPRRFIGAISIPEDCLPVVRLARRLEYRDGVVRPMGRRVVVMPAAVSTEFAGHIALGPAAVVPIRLEDGRRSTVARILLYAAALGVAGSVLFAYLDRGEIIDSHATVRPAARPARF